MIQIKITYLLSARMKGNTSARVYRRAEALTRRRVRVLVPSRRGSTPHTYTFAILHITAIVPLEDESTTMEGGQPPGPST